MSGKVSETTSDDSEETHFSQELARRLESELDVILDALARDVSVNIDVEIGEFSTRKRRDSFAFISDNAPICSIEMDGRVENTGAH